MSKQPLPTPGAEIIVRFIGVTSSSTDGRELLQSLRLEIYRRFAREYWEGETVPENYRNLIEEFAVRIRLAMPSAAKPLFIFIDALDQLTGAENAEAMDWLPEELPAHMRLIVSTTPGMCISVLESDLPAENLVQIPFTPVEQGKRVLDLWLEDAGRTLQPHQRQEVLGKFADCGLPLYLKLAFEKARRWKSYSDPQETKLQPDVHGVIGDLFARLSADSNHGPILTSRTLGYLATAKNGLTEDELLEVLSADVDLYAWFLMNSLHAPPDLLARWQAFTGEYIDLHWNCPRTAIPAVHLGAWFCPLTRNAHADNVRTDGALRSRN